MIHLREISFRPPAKKQGQFPFSIPAFQTVESIPFSTPVTFLVGENGSGKSTLMESIAVAANMTAAGSDHTNRDSSLDAVRPFARSLRLTWRIRTSRGFFLRAEDFFGYVKRLGQMRSDLEADKAQVREEMKGRSEKAMGLAMLPFSRELGAMNNQYERDISTFSHGESYLEFFQKRFVPGGLYLLDEPEAPLSPIRQLGFLSLMKEMVAQEAQFVIATHSPILMAFPGATILTFDDGAIRPVAYNDLEHVTLTRDFLNNPEQFLRHL